jgi:hypothetical protein
VLCFLSTCWNLGKVVNVHVGKHAGSCAAIRLGFDVPATWLLPHKVRPENERFASWEEKLVATIRWAFPPHEHEQFIADYRGC